MALGLGFFSRLKARGSEGSALRFASPGSGWALALVALVAAFMRLYRIHDLPL